MRVPLGTIIVSSAMLTLSACAATGESGSGVASIEELGYRATGAETACVLPRNIRSTKVLDDDHILFTMLQNKLYINTLRGSCPTLESEGRFSYTLHGSNLCGGEMIHVLSMIGTGPTCSLGDFIAVEAIAEDERQE